MDGKDIKRRESMRIFVLSWIALTANGVSCWVGPNAIRFKWGHALVDDVKPINSDRFRIYTRACQTCQTTARGRIFKIFRWDKAKNRKAAED
ncbi:unnamed protein product [Sphenostylis stenocarpa]|uniref:Uncharacterized protein n=1 Tax=Sphenostylis stenocarpa TaxID=92480 RepID=A0AA86SVI7_9FABA|nr:unnamed protein product [Sphenostylis stenocarpa]